MRYKLGAVFILLISCAANASQGLVRIESNNTVKETANKFETIAKSKGLTIFARIDHAKNANSVNLTLRPTEVIIFGNPKIGTLLMQCSQDVAIDLPQKVLISEDVNGKVWLSYNNPSYLKARYNMLGCDSVLKKVSGVLNMLSTAAAIK